MQKIDYEGKVWVLNNNNPQPLVDHTLKILGKLGVRSEDIVLTDTPTVNVGSVVVEIWPYELVIARVRTTRNESFISGAEFTIELKLDENGNYLDDL